MTQNLGTILGVWAHPDDETYLSAGIMAKARQAGQRVVCITATRGEAGSWDEERWPRNRMGQIREQELMEALAVLGINEHHFLGYVDGTCHKVALAEGAAKVLQFLRDIKPASVLTFGPDGATGHTDHQAISAWTTEAIRQWANPRSQLYYAAHTPVWVAEWRPVFEKVKAYYGDEYPEVTPADQLALDYPLSGDLLELKMKALGAQRSQLEGMIRAFGNYDVVRYAFAHEMFRLTG